MEDTFLCVLVSFGTILATLAVHEICRIVWFEIRLTRIMKDIRRHFELTNNL